MEDWNQEFDRKFYNYADDDLTTTQHQEIITFIEGLLAEQEKEQKKFIRLSEAKHKFELKEAIDETWFQSAIENSDGGTNISENGKEELYSKYLEK